MQGCYYPATRKRRWKISLHSISPLSQTVSDRVTIEVLVKPGDRTIELVRKRSSRHDDEAISHLTEMIQGIQRPWHRVRMLELIGIIELVDFVHSGGY